ncbi:phosphoglucomutase [Paenibacillus glycanilyticus]|uniref:phosphoglucomutase n=1 Tax=Paenibacillus glycanilyticus TaxID=126569 RepID=UPI001910FC90|nr:phosphoglucomutase [Paenibacillus glycanilyticus]
MPYQFVPKLNAKTDGSLYVVEERVKMTGGSFVGFLAHDNILESTIRVYTGSKYTGLIVKDVVVSIPAETPWRRQVKIFSNADEVYVTYETPGDVVEADDINGLQESLAATQKEIEDYKTNGVVDGGSFIGE